MINNNTINDNNTFTFEVTKNLKKEKINSQLISSSQIIKKIFPKIMTVEQFSHKNDTQDTYYRNNASTSSFFEAIFLSYSNHYNLKLSVSHFLIAIGQALSLHINQNSEKLRKEFVSFEGKTEIKIRRDNFVMGKENDWTSTFPEFCGIIKNLTNSDINNIIIDDTSVATPNSQIVSQICLMESMKAYFKYTVVTRCGIPNIILLGSVEDWQKLKDKVDALCKLNENDRLNLDFWLKYLVPVINNIVDTGINRKPDLSFWKNFAKIDDESGGPFCSGWINTFYPYLVDGDKYIKNKFMDYTKNNFFCGLKDNQIPQGISNVPFVWDYCEILHSMSFYGGFISTKVNEEKNTVEPELGWIIERKEILKERLDF